MAITFFYFVEISTLHAQDNFRQSIRAFSYEVTNGDGIVKRIILVKRQKECPTFALAVLMDKLVDYQTAVSVLSLLPANKKIIVGLIRENKPLTLKIELKPIPFELHDRTKLEYGWLMHDGDQLREILTSAKAFTREKYPAILLVQWLSCGSVEIPGDPADGTDYVITSFANNPNYIFYRNDKSGVGDSRGTPCNELTAKKGDRFLQKGVG